MILTLQEIKDYLKIDYSEEDSYLQNLIEISQIYIDSCCGELYKADNKLIKLATLAQYKLINDMYDNRSPYITDNSKRDIIITTIFDKLSNVEVV